MRSTILLIAGFLLLFLILSGGDLLYGSEVRGVTKDTIKMGVMLDVTGPAAADMAPILSGIRNCYRYVNEKGGVNGRMIKLLVEDDRYSIPMSLAGFKKLVFKDKVLHIAGPTSSHGTSALLPLFEKEKMPMMAYTASDEITKSYKRYAFTLSSDYEDQTAVTIDQQGIKGSATGILGNRKSCRTCQPVAFSFNKVLK